MNAGVELLLTNVIYFLQVRAISTTIYFKISKSSVMVIAETMLPFQVYVTALSCTPSSVANSNKNMDISLLS